MIEILTVVDVSPHISSIGQGKPMADDKLEMNIATGETSQDIIPFHFFGYFNFSNFIIFISIHNCLSHITCRAACDAKYGSKLYIEKEISEASFYRKLPKCDERMSCSQNFTDVSSSSLPSEQPV